MKAEYNNFQHIIHASFVAAFNPIHLNIHFKEFFTHSWKNENTNFEGKNWIQQLSAHCCASYVAPLNPIH